MLRGPTCVAGTWSERCVDRLPHCPRTIPTDPYRIDTAVPWVRLFYRLYLVRPACSSESACGNPRSLRRQRVAFWIVTVLVLGLIAVP